MQSLANRQPASTRYTDRTDTKAISVGLVLVGIVALLCGLFVAVQTVYFAVIAQSPMLLLDEWRVLPRYIEFMTGKLSLLSFLWEHHFEHRPALGRLLFILDAATVGGTQVLTRAISLCLCGLMAAFFAMLLLRQKQIPWGNRLIGVGLLVTVFLSNQQIENLIRGFNSTILITVWFFRIIFVDSVP